MTDQLPPIQSPPPPQPLSPRPARWYSRFFRGKFLFVSIGFHLLLAVVATYLVVHTMQERKLTYKAGPKSSNPSTRALEHKIQVKKQNTRSSPPQAKRITTTGVSQVVLPDLPTVAQTDDFNPSKMSGMGTDPGGFGAVGGGGMGGGGAGFSIFGLRSKASSVVLIIDISGSMVTGKKNPETWKKLEDEVQRALSGMDRKSTFNIILFSGKTFYFRGGLQPAESDNVLNAMNFVRQNSPATMFKGRKPGEKIDWAKEKGGRHSGTQPSDALKQAFRWDPDMIIFISDGEPTKPDTGDGVKALVQNLQKGREKQVKISAVAYFADGGQGFMKTMAESNGGVFKAIK
jgi:hypothetical protein